MTLLEKLKAGKENIKRISWPGTDQGVGITVLSRAQISQARYAAENTFKQAGIEPNLMTADEYEDERTVQMLYRALSDPENPGQPVAKTINDFKAAITTDEQDILAEEYLALEKECSPRPDKMTDKEVEDLIAEVKKTPGTTALSISDIATARRLIISLACPPEISQTDSGSTS